MLTTEFSEIVRKVALTYHLTIWSESIGDKPIFTVEELFNEYARGWDKTHLPGITKKEMTVICDILCEGSGFMSCSKTEPKQYVSQAAALYQFFKPKGDPLKIVYPRKNKPAKANTRKFNKANKDAGKTKAKKKIAKAQKKKGSK
jgi:hypothetical protein